MNSILEAIFEVIFEVLKFIVELIFELLFEVIKGVLWDFCWRIVVFNLGRIFLLLITFGHYPCGVASVRDMDLISCMGLFVIFAAWASIVIYNNWGSLVWGV